MNTAQVDRTSVEMLVDSRLDEALAVILPCYGKSPYEPSGVAKFPFMKHEIPGKLMDIFLPIFQIILFAMSPNDSENLKEKYSQIPSKINILSK